MSSQYRFTAAFPRRVFGKPDPRATDPKADPTLKVPGWSGATSQRLTPTGEQPSSPTRMVATGNLETINSSQQEQLSNN